MPQARCRDPSRRRRTRHRRNTRRGSGSLLRRRRISGRRRDPYRSTAVAVRQSTSGGAARAINWGKDPFARGAYSYATPKTRGAQSAMSKPDGGGIFFAGEALYAGPDMGTVEAALANGLETARIILAQH